MKRRIAALLVCALAPSAAFGELKVESIAVSAFSAKTGQLEPVDDSGAGNLFGDLAVVVKVSGNDTSGAKVKLKLEVLEGNKRLLAETRDFDDVSGYAPFVMFFVRSKIVCSTLTLTATLTGPPKSSEKKLKIPVKCYE